MFGNALLLADIGFPLERLSRIPATYLHRSCRVYSASRRRRSSSNSRSSAARRAGDEKAWKSCDDSISSSGFGFSGGEEAGDGLPDVGGESESELDPKEEEEEVEESEESEQRSASASASDWLVGNKASEGEE